MNLIDNRRIIFLWFSQIKVNIPLQQHPQLFRRLRGNVLQRGCVLQLPAGFQQDLCPICLAGIRSCVILDLAGQRRTDNRCNKHDSEGNQVPRIIDLKRPKRLCKEKIEYQDTQHAGNRSPDLPAGKYGTGQHAQHIHHDDIRRTKSKYTVQGKCCDCGACQACYADHQIFSGILSALGLLAFFLPFQVLFIIGIWDQEDLQGRGLPAQLLRKTVPDK